MSFKSLMQHIGHDIKVGLEFILPYAQTATGKVAVSLLAPSLGPLFNQTVAAVATAEQAAVAVKNAGGSLTGQQKAASVVQLMGPLIKQVLTDAGKPADDAAVQKYIDSVVTILNTAPAPPSA